MRGRGGWGGGISGCSLLRCLELHCPLLLTLYMEVRGDGGKGGGEGQGRKG